MKTLLLAGATVALLTAVNFAPAMAQGPKLSIGNTQAGISQPVDNTQPIYPIPRTMYEEVIAKYRTGSLHKAVYENLTGNQMWSIVQSKFGRPSQQSAIAEARQACEDYAARFACWSCALSATEKSGLESKTCRSSTATGTHLPGSRLLCFLAASWRIDFPASEFGEIFYHVILGGSAVLEDPEPAHRLWGWSASCAPNPPPKIWAAWRHSTGLLSGRRL
jgi:hypothetical protein